MTKKGIERWWYGVDFYRNPMEGQLTVTERRAIYDLVRKYRPSNVFEVGTWKGGGSTYILSSALKKNGNGALYTVELSPEFYAHAVGLYENALAPLKPYVRFHLGNSLEVYPPILETIRRVDFLFLDGAEDADQTLREYRLFSSKLLSGSLVACHDWKTEKTAKVRACLEDPAIWVLETKILEGPTGFAAFRKK